MRGNSLHRMLEGEIVEDTGGERCVRMYRKGDVLIRCIERMSRKGA